MVTLKDGKIIDNWATLLEQCQGEEEGLLRGVEQALDEFQAPGVHRTRETVAPGWLKGLFGKKRDFLIVTHERFDDYTVSPSDGRDRLRRHVWTVRPDVAANPRDGRANHGVHLLRSARSPL